MPLDFVVVVTCHDDHRIREHLMGLMKLTTDEVIRDDETRLQKKGSTNAYATDEDIWTIQCHQ